MFSTKSIRVSIPKTQYRQLMSLLDQLKDIDDDISRLDYLIRLALSEFLDKYFADTAKRISRNLKKIK